MMQDYKARHNSPRSKLGGQPKRRGRFIRLLMALLAFGVLALVVLSLRDLLWHSEAPASAPGTPTIIPLPLPPHPGLTSASRAASPGLPA